MSEETKETIDPKMLGYIQKAQAEIALAQGSYDKFMQYVSEVYKLVNQDSINIVTGEIIRQAEPKAKE